MEIKNIGTTSDNLYNIKNMLKKLGYKINDNSNAFTLETKTAIESFQNDMGLMVDGVINTKTYSKLSDFFNIRFPDLLLPSNNKSEPIKIKEEIQEVQEVKEVQEVQEVQEVKELNKNIKPVLKLLDESDCVTKVQLILQRLGFFYAKVDGKFGVRTEDAIKYFQTSEGLKPDGIVGEKTWKRLDKHIKNIDLKTDVIKNRSMLKIGDENEDVSDLKSMLKKSSYYDGEINNVFDQKTDVAVKQFQKSIQLRGDGIVGSETWIKLNDQTEVNNTSNYIDKDMLDVQTKLNKLGFYTKKSDGQYNTSLENAIKNFQMAVRIETSGLLDNITLEKLDEYTQPVTYDTLPKTKYIKEPNENSDMLDVQLKLKKLGFLDEEHNTSLENAIKNFQMALKITPTGLIDNITLKKIDEYSTPVVFDDLKSDILKIGDVGEKVLKLQHKLFRLGFYDYNIDGEFGNITEQAVKCFQLANQLTPTGTIINEDINEYKVEINNYPVLKYGAKGGYVKLLQTRLKQIGFYDDSITGSFDIDTENAVMIFQKNNNLNLDGVVEKNTWRELLKSMTKQINKINKQTLFIGDNGPDVLELQNILKHLLYFNEEVTGVFDYNTLMAVTAFQFANKLIADGVVDETTWAKLL